MSFRIDFFGIGAPKCATTWLTYVLDEHPQICLPKLNKVNELNYFSHSRANGKKSEYEISGMKSFINSFKHCNFSDKKIKIGEMSTHYLFDKSTAKIIKKHFPNAKIIVSLREPVSRAYSDYLMHKHFAGLEKESFLVSFHKKREELDPLNYKYKSKYYEQLKEYYRLFPKENIKVIILEDIKKNPLKVIKEVYSFIGVDSKFVPPSANKVINESLGTKNKAVKWFMNLFYDFAHLIEKVGFGRIISFAKRTFKLDILIPKINEKNAIVIKKEVLDEKTLKELKKEFKEDVKNLEKLIGRNLLAWK